MRKIKTSTATSIKFSAFSTAIILLIGVSITISSYILVNKQISSDLQHESDEIVNEYLGYSDGRIQYIDNATKQSITHHLADKNYSAILYNEQLELIGAFGIFEVAQNSDEIELLTSTNKKIEIHDNALHLEQALQNQAAFFSQSFDDGSQQKILTTPIVIEGKTVGVLQIAETAEEMIQFLRISLSILLVISTLGITASWLFGSWISRQAFQPLNKMIKKIAHIQHGKLQERIEVPGHQDDEIALLANEFNKMMARIESGSEKQREFVSNASHEFKTPLANALSSIELLLTSTKPVDTEKTALQVKQNLLDLNQLIDDLLILAQIIEHPSVDKTDVAEIDLAKIIDVVIEKNSTDIAAKKLELKKNIGEGCVARISAEYAKIMLSNIIANAIKYSNDSAELEITCKNQDGKTEIEISDFGIGMTHKELKKVFERFYRGKSAKHSTSGSGVGLSIVKEICSLYQVAVDVRSKKDQGTTVRLIFPSK